MNAPFLFTANSCRSILGVAAFKHLAPTGTDCWDPDAGPRAIPFPSMSMRIYQGVSQ